MLDLFANIFGHADEYTSRLPPSLLKKVTERAIDGTDPRLRIVSGYAKTLKKPVLHAADYIIDMIDSLPAPVLASRESLNADPGLAALLYSAESMEHIIERDPAVAEFRAANPLVDGPVTGLLVAHRAEKHGFGYGDVEGQTVKDVPRTTVSFDRHVLVELAVDEQETRRLLKRRAFDHLLTVALQQISERKEERDSLAGRRALLLSKLDIMQRSGSFTEHTGAADKSKLQASLEQIEQQLAKLGASEDVLSANLATITDVLSNAESHFWLVEKVLCLDRMYVLHDEPGPRAPEILFTDLHDSEDRRVTIRLVSIRVR